MNLLHCTEEVTWDNQLMTRAGHTPHNFKSDSGPEFSQPPPPEPQLGCKQLFNQTLFKCVGWLQLLFSLHQIELEPAWSWIINIEHWLIPRQAACDKVP